MILDILATLFCTFSLLTLVVCAVAPLFLEND